MSDVKEPDKQLVYKAYNDFIRQLEIVDICLVSARVQTFGYVELPDSHSIRWSAKSWYESEESELNVYQQYNLTLRDTEERKRAASLSITFRATYASKLAMTGELFSIFEKRNLLLNTWPYFREFTHGIFARMGWFGIIAPTYKI